MKFLIAALFSLGSLTAFSEVYTSPHNFEYFHGSGTYKTPSGRTGNFLASLTIRKLDDGQFNFIYGIYHKNRNVHYEITLQDREGASFFDIKSGDEVVGYGYCLGRKCHFEYDLMGKHIEDTLYRHAKTGALSFMGSKSNADGVMKSWKIFLKKVF